MDHSLSSGKAVNGQSEYWNQQRVSPDSQTSDDFSNIQTVVDILFIFVSGIAIIVGLIILVYVLLVVLERIYGFWTLMGWTNIQENYNHPLQMPSAEAFGPVAYKARLWGMTLEERKAVLEWVFSDHVTSYNCNESLKKQLPAEETLNRKEGILDLECGIKVKDSIAPSDPGTTPRESSIVPANVESEGRHIQTVTASGETGNKNVANVLEQGQKYLNGELGEVTKKRERCSEEKRETSSISDGSIVEQRDPTHSGSSPVFNRLRCNGNDDVLLTDQRLGSSCAICIGEYGRSDRVLHGLYCKHLFHYDCVMPWMESLHDHCPYCRVEMMSAMDMRRAAFHVLDKGRLAELSRTGEKPKNANSIAPTFAADAASSPLSNVSERLQQREHNLPFMNLFRNYLREPSSTALSDQAEVGPTVSTPRRSPDMSPGSAHRVPTSAEDV